METDTRLSVLEAKSDWMRSIVISSIGWTLVLTGAVVGAVLVINAQFSSINTQFSTLDAKIAELGAGTDSKIEALQNLIEERIILNSEDQRVLITEQVDENPEPTG